MDLELTEEQQLFGSSVARFLEKEYDFERRRREINGDATHCVWRGLAELGVLALPVPEEMGGLGGGPLEIGLVMEALGGRLVIEPVLLSIILASGVLKRTARPDIHADLLASAAADATRLGFAHEEASARLATKARKDAGDWRVSGRKSLALGAARADELIVSARDEQDMLRLFLVPANVDGLTRQPVRLLDGSHAADIELEEVLIEGARLLDVEDAASVLNNAVDDAALAACWEAIGAMRAALAQTAEYMRQREQFGRPLAAFQVIQHHLAEMSVCCEEARAAALLAALVHDRGQLARARSLSAAKVKIGRCANFVAKGAVQLHGGMGVSEELPIASYFRKLLMFENLLGDAASHLRRYAQTVVAEGSHRQSVVLPPAALHPRSHQSEHAT